MSVSVTTVTISKAGLGLLMLESEKETIDRLILATMREIDQNKSRLADLQRRRDITVRVMCELSRSPT
jgi:hypothetical protein